MTQFKGPFEPKQRRSPGRVRTASSVTGGFPEAPLINGVGEPAGPAEPPLINIPTPLTFEELLFTVVMVNRSRETHVIVEQTVAAGVTGTVTVAVPANEVDIQRFIQEGGDGSISYSVDIQAAGQTAIANHRITGGTREFARYWEKTTQVIVDFTNNDAINPALLQLSWIAVRLDTTKWTQYRDGLISLYEMLGIEA